MPDPVSVLIIVLEPTMAPDKVAALREAVAKVPQVIDASHVTNLDDVQPHLAAVLAPKS